ncbi:MAG: OmpA family protein [Devosia sp.]|nr:OmpA family protein [Devosia sp.]
MVGAAREVSWIRLELSGGISIERDATFLEFSELIGNGTQSGLDLSDRFTGSWRGRGVDLSLAQDGTAVTGCYDGDSPLSGTVDGVVLRALGANPVGIRSQFILIVGEDGAVRGLRSTNGAPFRIYDGAAAAASSCSEPAAPALGCGATIHGIGFGYDSDVIRPQSAPLVAALHESLAGVEASRIEIRGHSSSEGSDSYNLDLSQRRAQSVVNALAALGLDAGKMTALGRGEAEPIASNEDEAGRSLNRRVEVICGG